MIRIFISLTIILLSCTFCKKDDKTIDEQVPIAEDTTYAPAKFCMGVDLSYVNQILDHSGVYKDSGLISDPYRIFKNHGANTVRVRIWHNPIWTKTVYTPAGSQMYSDIADVEKTIKKAKDLGMAVDLDFHYSDTWADPKNQAPPAAWLSITDIAVLKDSIYQYTFKTLTYLNSKGLMPEMVQIGNEINSGLFVTGIPAGFPDISIYNKKWTEQGIVLNAAIKAVRDAGTLSAIKPKILLHIADPQYVQWWFDGIINQAKVSDFDVVGFSYYPLWHTVIPFSDLGSKIAFFKSRYKREVMIVEVGYPWTKSGADSYNNTFYDQTPVTSYPFTVDGQYNFMVDLTQKVITAGGSGIMYWEPAWITSQMKDKWGTGSTWENVAFFDFNGNTQKGIDYMNYKYTFPVN